LSQTVWLFEFWQKWINNLEIYVMSKIAINSAIFCYDDDTLKVLLSKENISTNTKWGILTGTLQNNESADDAAFRLMQEYGVGKNIFLRQLKTFIDPGRQDSDWRVTIGYYGLMNIEEYKTIFGISQCYKRWWKVTDIPDLLFNHNKILDFSLYQLSNIFRESAVFFELLPKEFTLSELTNLYKGIFGFEANESGFCKKIVQKRIIVSLIDKHRGTTIETERRYKFNARQYEKLAAEKYFFIF
jgi:8-oxo-dGTP diphosphatase